MHHLLGPRGRGSKLEITTIIAHIGDDMREDSMSGFCITFWAIWAIWGLLFYIILEVHNGKTNLSNPARGLDPSSPPPPSIDMSPERSKSEF